MPEEVKFASAKCSWTVSWWWLCQEMYLHAHELSGKKGRKIVKKDEISHLSFNKCSKAIRVSGKYRILMLSHPIQEDMTDWDKREKKISWPCISHFTCPTRKNGEFLKRFSAVAWWIFSLNPLCVVLLNYKNPEKTSENLTACLF